MVSDSFSGYAGSTRSATSVFAACCQQDALGPSTNVPLHVLPPSPRRGHRGKTEGGVRGESYGWIYSASVAGLGALTMTAGWKTSQLAERRAPSSAFPTSHPRLRSRIHTMFPIDLAVSSNRAVASRALQNSRDEDQTLALSLSQIFGRGDAVRPDFPLSCPLPVFRAATPFPLPRSATSVGWRLVSQIFGGGNAVRPNCHFRIRRLLSARRIRPKHERPATCPSPFALDGETEGRQMGDEGRKGSRLKGYVYSHRQSFSTQPCLQSYLDNGDLCCQVPLRSSKDAPIGAATAIAFLGAAFEYNTMWAKTQPYPILRRL